MRKEIGTGASAPSAIVGHARNAFEHAVQVARIPEHPAELCPMCANKLC